MQIYARNIILRHPEHNGTPATLVVVRLPQSWYAVVHASDELYKSFDQPLTDRNRAAFACFADDEYFLNHVRLVSDFAQGVSFDFVTGAGTSVH